ncbi:MAG: flagellar basal body P-ring formation chaperone FlgA [Candidatus Hydrogenedentota bacterium]
MLFVVLTAAFCAAAEDRVSLRDEVFVKGPKVVLGDIADVRGDNAAYLSSFELGQAASPGNSTVVNVALVKSKLNAAGIIDVTVDGSPRVTARTMYLDITKGMISDALREFIEIEMPWQLDATTIEIAPPAQGFVVPDGNVEFRFRRNPQYAFIGAGLFQGDVLVDGKVEKSFNARAAIESYGDVVTAATDIERGRSISPSDLRLEKRAMSGLDRGAFFDFADVTGGVAKTSLLAGELVTARKIRPATLVQRGSLVSVETRLGALTVSTRGKALSEGAAGEMVRVLNLESGQELAGLVRDDGVVVVE